MQEDEIQQDGAEENTAEIAETEETVEETQTEEVVEEKKEEEVDYRGKLNATNKFLEKEGYTFKGGKWVPPTKPTTETTTSSPSLADAQALLKADVHEDDVERVEKFAKSEGVSIREALKNDELKAILAIRQEKRATANAANISNVRRGPTKTSDDVLIANANKGKLPDNDEDIERLIAAKAKQK